MKNLQSLNICAMFLAGTLLMLLYSGCEPERMVEPEDVFPIRIAVLTGEGFHDGEAYMPIGYLANRGVHITVIGIERGVATAYNSDLTINIEQSVRDVSVMDFEALILPGGQAPSTLRENDSVVQFVREFFQLGKPVAAICHGPQILITAGVMEGRDSTGIGAIQDELKEAGANYLDQEVVIDDNLITSRVPADLAAFCKAIEDKVLAPTPELDSPQVEDLP